MYMLPNVKHLSKRFNEAILMFSFVSYIYICSYSLRAGICARDGRFL